MISVAEARAAIDEVIHRRGLEQVCLRAALGRVLGTPLLASFDLPRFDCSAMDGYAVRSADTAEASRDQPVALEVVGLSAAGPKESLEIGTGECAQVMTGGCIPQGADAVVIVEDTGGFSDGTARIFAASKPGANIRQRGEELAGGSSLLVAGERIGPAELGALASFGYAEVEVAKRPRLALLTTGDELKEVGNPLSPGEIYNSTASVLGSLAGLDAEVVLSESVGDGRAALGQALHRACECADVLVICGGVSMGRFDYVREQVAALEFTEAFWRVAQKPGKPLLFAHDRLGEKVLFGLPGNPVSSLVCFIEYVRPALLRWQGETPAPCHLARLSVPLARDATRHRFVLARATTRDGCLWVTPSPKQGSHMLTASLGANCICEAAPGHAHLSAGDPTSIRLLPWAQGLGSTE